MSDELDQLLSRPDVVAAVGELGVASVALEDVLTALRSYGPVRIDLDDDAERPYVCLLAGGAERARGRTVLHAAVACWAEVLESVGGYTRHGITALERFLLDPDMA